MASGKLGDLILFGNDGSEFLDAIEAGMLLDWSKGNILELYGPDIKRDLAMALKKNADVFGGGTSIYGFGHNVSSTALMSEAGFYHPDIRFDLYQQIGSPPIPNMMTYLDVLKRMVDIAPRSDSGLPSYAFSLFSDWDGDMVMSVKCMGAYYGYDEFGFTLYHAETNTVQPILDDNSLYLQGLRFFNRAYQMGILDPDSATQTFSDVIEKYADGRVYWSLFSWLGPSNYNTAERLAQGKGMFAVPAEDQRNIVYGTNIYGSNRIWSIGSKAKNPERIMALINWLCTPEGIMTNHYGPQGLTWDYDENNKAYLTPHGIQIQDGDKSVQIPEEFGGGIYLDGENKLNNTTFTLDEISPITGERYNKEFWSSELNRETNPAQKAWREWAGVLSADELLDKRNLKAVVVASDFVMAARSDSLEQKWVQVSNAIKTGSWRAIYANTDTEYNRIVTEMISQAKAFGYDECIEWNIEQGKLRAAAVRRALDTR
jgi:multiple sugar transport system substrate-binding protein/putative aldouronate transport system substrate-binding protein